MTTQKPENQNVSDQHAPPPAQPPHTGRQLRPLLIMLLAFFILVVLVFIFQRTDTIDWIEDYDTGIKLAEKQNKPVLLAFYKEFAPMYTNTRDNTYNAPAVINYVHQNFVPILIDVLKQPEIAERYKIGYYPTHYIKLPHSDEIFGPLIGYDPPHLFIKKLDDLLEKMNPPDK